LRHDYRIFFIKMIIGISRIQLQQEIDKHTNLHALLGFSHSIHEMYVDSRTPFQSLNPQRCWGKTRSLPFHPTCGSQKSWPNTEYKLQIQIVHYNQSIANLMRIKKIYTVTGQKGENFLNNYLNPGLIENI
jgi:hypothetical protein